MTDKKMNRFIFECSKPQSVGLEGLPKDLKPVAQIVAAAFILWTIAFSCEAAIFLAAYVASNSAGIDVNLFNGLSVFHKKSFAISQKTSVSR